MCFFLVAPAGCIALTLSCILAKAPTCSRARFAAWTTKIETRSINGDLIAEASPGSRRPNRR